MANKNKKKHQDSDDAKGRAVAAAVPESQRERWVKYGSNVALTVVVVLVVATLVVYLAQRYRLREDTTAGGFHSLKEPTVALIENTPGKVKLVSLYTRVKQGDEGSSARDDGGVNAEQRYQQVADLLAEFEREGNGITAEMIDPIAEPAKVDQLLAEVSGKYANDVNRYQTLLKEFTKTTDEITKKIDAETKQIRAMPPMPEEGGLQLLMDLVQQTVDRFPDDLQALKGTIPKELEKRQPNYKAAADTAKGQLQELSDNVKGIVEAFGKITPELDKAMAELRKEPGAAAEPAPEAVETPSEGEAEKKPDEPEEGSEGADQIEDKPADGAAAPAEAPAEAPADPAPEKAPEEPAAAPDRETAKPQAAEEPLTPEQRAERIAAMERVKKYMTEAPPRFTEIQTLADGLAKRLGELGELRQLEELRQKKTNSIVVMGEKDMIVLSEDAVWKQPTRSGGGGGAGDDKDRVRFAGEQQVGTAILVLTKEKRPKVVFVRMGGFPQTINIRQPPVMYAGPYNAVAERLREYNFQVLEKDLSDQWPQQAMQMQMQLRMQTEMMGTSAPRLPEEFFSEASEQDLKESVWVVMPAQDQMRSPIGPTPSPVGQRLAEHLNAGGSALILTEPRSSPLSDVLDDWGIEVKTEHLALHPKLGEAEGRVSDQVEVWRRETPVFVTDNYGDHAIATPLGTLEGMFFNLTPVTLTAKEGYTGKPLLPLGVAPDVWGENLQFPDLDSPKFDTAKEKDLGGEINGGAAVEKKGGGRVVVIGAAEFATNYWATVKDRQLRPGGDDGLRVPGNSELFTNSVFWLAGFEKMIDISPAARDVALIDPNMSVGTRRAWGVGVLFIGLPLLALAAGAVAYFARRD